MEEKSKRRALIRKKRHRRIRKKVFGTPERPRLCVRRSLKHIYAQLVDDSSSRSLLLFSSLSPEVKERVDKKMNKREISHVVGQLVAEKALAKNITKVVFDRGGYLYHGRVKALAEGVREKGLQF